LSKTLGEEQMSKLLTLLLLTGSAFAAQPCPVTITHFTALEHDIMLGGINASDKPISGVRFQAFKTSVGERQNLLQAFDVNRHKAVKPNQKVGGRWDYPFNSYEANGAYVEKVQFEDGTTWQDDGSHSCVFTK
jgi:hypothetical protein